MPPEEIEKLEKMYKEIMFGSEHSHSVVLMNWDDFRKLYGENGEKLSSDYEVHDDNGCALIVKIK